MARFWVSATVGDEEEDDDDDDEEEEEYDADLRHDDDDDNDTTAVSNTRRRTNNKNRHAQHCDHDTNGEQNDDEASGIWKHERWQGPLVQMTVHSPQNEDSNGRSGPSSCTAQSYFPGSLPSVALPRRRQILVHQPLSGDDDAINVFPIK